MTSKEYSRCVSECAKTAYWHIRLKTADLNVALADGGLAETDIGEARKRALIWRSVHKALEKILEKENAGSPWDIKTLNRASSVFPQELRQQWGNLCRYEYASLTDKKGRFHRITTKIISEY